MNLNGKLEYINRTQAFCIKPWVHLHINTSGDVTACCVVRESFGNIKDKSIQEIWQGNEIKEFRRKMLHDVKDNRCNSCYALEENGGRSHRQITNELFSEKLFWVRTTHEDGFAPDAEPVYWDFRFSNICNFRCRTCWHGSSSNWFKEAKELKETQGETPIIYGIKVLDNFLDQLSPYFHVVEEIYFAGGEPLVMEGHYELLKILIQKKMTNVRLSYTTNFSILHYKNNEVVELWKHFPNIYAYISLDGSSERGQFIRKGQSWDIILANREIIREKVPHVRILCNFTVSVFNIFHLTDFHKEMVQKGFIEVEQMRLNILQEPDFYSIRILPSEMKNMVAVRIKAHIDWIGSFINENNEEAVRFEIKLFEDCITHMYSENWQDKIPYFVKRCNTLDNIRNERLLTIFPELEELFLSPRAS